MWAAFESSGNDELTRRFIAHIFIFFSHKVPKSRFCSQCGEAIGIGIIPVLFSSVISHVWKVGGYDGKGKGNGGGGGIVIMDWLYTVDISEDSELLFLRISSVFNNVALISCWDGTMFKGFMLILPLLAMSYCRNIIGLFVGEIIVFTVGMFNFLKV